MSIQHAITTDLVYAPEAQFGVEAARNSATATQMRKVSSSLALGKDTFSSNEARADLQIADFRHGTKRPAGSIEAELSNKSYDPFLEALIRGTWAAGTVAEAVEYVTVAASKVTDIDGAFTWTGGDPVMAGFRRGDIIRTTGSTGNDAAQFRITGFSGPSNRTIAVTPAPAAHEPLALANFRVAGAKLRNGLVKRSFTLEVGMPDAGFSEVYSGMRAGSGQFRLPPNGMATLGIEFMGRDMQVRKGVDKPHFTTPRAAGTDAILAGPSGAIRMAGAEQAVVTALEFTIANALSAEAVVGSLYVPDIFYGSNVVTGNVSAYLTDASLVEAYVNEKEVDLVAVCTSSSGGGLSDFLSFNMQRVKLNGSTKTIAAAGGVIASFPFQALLATAGGGLDAATMTIQRSNPLA